MPNTISIRRSRPAPEFDPSALTVLIADDDDALRSELAEYIRGLGCQCYEADSAQTALQLLSEQPAINTVIADVRMPRVDGIELIEGARQLRSDGASLGSVLITGYQDQNVQLRALRTHVTDMLFKPVGGDHLRSALARVYQDVHGGGRQGASPDVETQLNEIAGAVIKLGQRLQRLTGVADVAEDVQPQLPSGVTIDKATLIRVVRQMIRSRRIRDRFFHSAHFGEPAWDILLDLTLARLENNTVSVSSVCIASGVPMSTAMRWINEMVAAGLIQRRTDPNDGRRNFVNISPSTMQDMLRYLATVISQNPVPALIKSEAQPPQLN